MADGNLDPKVLQDIAEELARFGENTAEFAESIKRASTVLSGNTKQYRDNTQIQDDFGKSIKNTVLSLQGGSKIFDKVFGVKTLGAVEHSFRSLQNSVDKITTQNEQQDARDQLIKIRQMYAMQQSTQLVIEPFKQLSVATGKAVKALQGISPDVVGGTQILGTVIDSVGKAGSVLGGIIGNLGGFLSSSLNPQMVVLGKVAGGFGGALKGLSEEGAKVFGALNDFLSKELATVVSSYTKLSSAGVVFGEGLTGLSKISAEAGIPMQMFANAAASNAEIIASSGLGLQKGFKRLTSALTSDGGQLQQSLQGLGIGTEEQIGIMAETMKTMRAYGKTLTSTDPEIREQTLKYAQSLKIIAGITGQDAKAKESQVKRAQEQMRFQAELAKMTPEQARAIKTAMQSMSQVQIDMLANMVKYDGQLVDRELAGMAALSPTLKEQTDVLYRQLKDRSLTQESYLDSEKTYNEKVQKELVILADSIGYASTGFASELSSKFSSMWAEILPKTADAITSVQEEVAKNLKQVEEATANYAKSTVNIQRAIAEKEAAFVKSGAMDMYLVIVEKVTGGLKDFMGAIGDTSAKLREMVTGEKISYSSSEIEKITQNLALTNKAFEKASSMLVDASIDAGYSEMKYDEAKSALQKSQKEYDEMLRTTGKTSTSNVIPTSPDKGSANGNILKGPESGYKALLHGVEAVVPLPDGRNMPVEISGNINSGLSREDRSILQNMARIEDIVALKDSIENQQRNLREMTDLFARAVDVLGEQRDISREMLHVLY